MKKKALFALFSVLLLVSMAVGVLVATKNFDTQFIIKDEKLIASYLDANEVFLPTDSEDAFKIKLREAVSFFQSNGINTVVIPFNEGGNSIVPLKGFTDIYEGNSYFDKKDIIKSIKSEFASNKIQLIMSVNCTGFSDSEISATINGINENYALGGIMLSGYSSSAKTLQDIKMPILKKHKNFWFALESDTAQDLVEIQQTGAVDFFVFNKIDESEYRRLKQGVFKDTKILFSYKTEKFLSDLFLLSNFGELDGLVLTEYTTPQQDLGIYKSMLDTSVPLQNFNFSVDNTFGVAYPGKDISTYYSGIFVTGTADPNDKVYVNSEETVVSGEGIFGKFLELKMGENLVTVEQGSNYQQYIVTRKAYTGTSTPKQNDNTYKAGKGQKIQTTGPLTSILTDKNDDSSIMEGLPAGTQLVVEASEQTSRGNFYTYAYKLSNGGYVLAKNVRLLSEEEYAKPVLSGAEVVKQENGDEILTIKNTGNPAVVSYFDDEKVQFAFLNTEFDPSFVVPTSELIGSTTVAMSEGNTVITINCVKGNEIWGYFSEVKDGQTNIYLKKTPRKTPGEKPLQNVTIMLDPGHGDQDGGAPAVGGIKGPLEKDLNLAVSLATKQCLEKLGATVLMTRQDDTFFTLDERRDSVNIQKPDLFIAQHHNSLDMSADGSQAFGTEVYYFTPQSKAVAEIMCNEITTLTGRKNRGQKFGYFYVTRTDIAPSVLVEYAFVVNPIEYSTLYSDIEIYKAAFGTAQAVLDLIPE